MMEDGIGKEDALLPYFLVKMQSSCWETYLLPVCLWETIPHSDELWDCLYISATNMLLSFPDSHVFSVCAW